jgi:hypothetical protein
MEPLEIDEEEVRPASQSSGTGTVDSGDGERVHLLDNTLNGPSSEDGRTEPLLKVRHYERSN